MEYPRFGMCKMYLISPPLRAKEVSIPLILALQSSPLYITLTSSPTLNFISFPPLMLIRHSFPRCSRHNKIPCIKIPNLILESAYIFYFDYFGYHFLSSFSYLKHAGSVTFIVLNPLLLLLLGCCVQH